MRPGDSINPVSYTHLDVYKRQGNQAGCFKEAVCIDEYRVYDYCGDKDCLEDLRVYFTEAGQQVIDQACNVRIRNAQVITVYLDLEPVPFHKGFYSIDMTFFFEVNLDAVSYTHLGVHTLYALPSLQREQHPESQGQGITLKRR